jgi:hypothetical protein
MNTLLIIHLIVSVTVTFIAFLYEDKITLHELIFMSFICLLPIVNLFILLFYLKKIYITCFKDTRLYEYLKDKFNK